MERNSTYVLTDKDDDEDGLWDCMKIDFVV